MSVVLLLVVSTFKCVNEAVFLCCWPVDKLSNKLTAFTGVLLWCLGVCVRAFVCMSGAKGSFPRGRQTPH